MARNLLLIPIFILGLCLSAPSVIAQGRSIPDYPETRPGGPILPESSTALQSSDSVSSAPLPVNGRPHYNLGFSRGQTRDYIGPYNSGLAGGRLPATSLGSVDFATEGSGSSSPFSLTRQALPPDGLFHRQPISTSTQAPAYWDSHYDPYDFVDKPNPISGPAQINPAPANSEEHTGF